MSPLPFPPLTVRRALRRAALAFDRSCARTADHPNGITAEELAESTRLLDLADAYLDHVARIRGLA